MRPYEAASPSVEVNGETVFALVAGMTFGAERARRVLASHGIHDPRPGQWYPQQAWLDTFREIASTLGPTTLFNIGLQIPDLAKFPASIATLDEALAALDPAYQMNHRGGPIGHYAYHPEGPGRAHVVCDGPYPPEFDRGILHALAARYKPAGTTPEVRWDPACPSRRTGGDSCTFRVTW